MSKKKNDGVAGHIIVKLNVIQFISSEHAVAFPVNNDDIELFQALESVVSKLE